MQKFLYIGLLLSLRFPLTIDYETLITYFKQISNEYKRGESGELTFRSYLKNFIETLRPSLKLSEENKKIKGVGRPDYTCFKGSVKIGYVETKDIGVDLDKELKGEQIERYSTGAIPNIILTDYNRFILYSKNEKRFDLTLFDYSTLGTNKPRIKESSANLLPQLLSSFLSFEQPTIKDSEELAFELSKRASVLNIFAKEELNSDLSNNDYGNRSSVFGFYEAFRELIKDASIEECVDAYAQTITYGLFLARISSSGPLDRNTASLFIPTSIKIIKKIFENISGEEIPDSLSWVVDEIIDILNSTDIEEIISDFVLEGKNYKDPFIHFYEDFLSQYDKKKKKKLGVYYTPEPVVSFITDSINRTLKSQLSVPLGFADQSLRCLDFATGTGTFLANSFVIALNEIRNSDLSGLETDKIRNHLLENFYGFEILVSPYVIAHLKLNTLLAKEGYKLSGKERVQIYLTNTLDPAETIENFHGFLKELTQETLIANTVKLKKQILVVMGNPPYSVSSSNKSEWITNLLEDYKEGLKEKNTQPLSDDYIKFLRFAQWKIEQNGSGIIGVITNNSFLDGLIHKVIRKKLVEDFDLIYIMNLHGDSDRKEVDDNVFDIKKGVAISFFVKTGRKATLPHVYYFSTLENNIISRSEKYEFLSNNSIETISWKEIKPESPDYWLVDRTQSKLRKRKNEWSLIDIFKVYKSGIKTARDDFFLDTDQQVLANRMKFSLSQENLEIIAQKYGLKSSSGWSIKKLESIRYNEKCIIKIAYRPFDERWIYYDPRILSRPRYDTMQHLLREENLSLVSVRQFSEDTEFNHVYIADKVVDIRMTLSSRGSGFVFPLYTYDDVSKKCKDDPCNAMYTDSGKKANFNSDFLEFINQQYGEISPEELLWYIYGIMNSDKYKKKYSESLRIDFPKIPFMKDREKFDQLSSLGKRLTNLHLLKVRPEERTASFPIPGERFVENPVFKDGRVYINQSQFFGGVSQDIWDFMTCGYQVLKKWLNERKSKFLSLQEIEDFLTVISVISETLKLIDELGQIKI